MDFSSFINSDSGQGIMGWIGNIAGSSGGSGAGNAATKLYKKVRGVGQTMASAAPSVGQGGDVEKPQYSTLDVTDAENQMSGSNYLSDKTIRSGKGAQANDTMSSGPTTVSAINNSNNELNYNQKQDYPTQSINLNKIGRYKYPEEEETQIMAPPYIPTAPTRSIDLNKIRRYKYPEEEETQNKAPTDTSTAPSLTPASQQKQNKNVSTTSTNASKTNKTDGGFKSKMNSYYPVDTNYVDIGDDSKNTNSPSPDNSKKNGFNMSDSSLKNYSHLNDNLDCFGKINAYLFKYKPEAQKLYKNKGVGVDDKPHVGVMAQELAANPVTSSSVNKDNNGFLEVDTKSLTMTNTAMIAELIRKVNMLEEKLKEIY